MYFFYLFRSLTAIMAFKSSSSSPHSPYIDSTNTHFHMLEPYRFSLVINSTTVPIFTPSSAIISFDVDGIGKRWRARLMTDENHTVSSMYLTEHNSSAPFSFSRLRTSSTSPPSVLDHIRYGRPMIIQLPAVAGVHIRGLRTLSHDLDENLADYARWIRINQKFISSNSQSKNSKP